MIIEMSVHTSELIVVRQLLRGPLRPVKPLQFAAEVTFLFRFVLGVKYRYNIMLRSPTP